MYKHGAQPLESLDALVLGCANGHRFDVNKRGYLSVLDPSNGIVGDPRPLLEARARFLGAGYYQPIVDAVVATLPTATPLSVLDSGAGTGFYLQQVLYRADAPADPLAVDASQAAVAMTVAATGSPGLVADVWRPSPVRDSRADVILCIFAPRNPSEFARILRPSGRLIVVTPTERHLNELREAGLVMGIESAKRERLDNSLNSLFRLVDRHGIDFSVELSTAAAEDLTGMGPSGHHERVGAWSGGTVSVSVELSVFEPTSPSETTGRA